MDRPVTQMSTRPNRVSSSRTPRTSIDSLSLTSEVTELARPKTALTSLNYLRKKPKTVVKEEIIELPVCRPTTSVRKKPVCNPPASQSDFRPSTAPFPAKSWTQLVRDSTFHDQKPSRRKGSDSAYCPKNAWEDFQEKEDDNEYRIVLVGKSGSGKSSTGNCILNEDYFGKRSEKCRYESVNRFGKKLSVVDTYDVFDRHTNENINQKELLKLVGMTSPGFHILVLVVAIENISKKEHHLFREFVRHFGNDVKSRTIVLFTRRDILDNDGTTIYGYVCDVPKGMQEVMEQCKRRYIAFNNLATGRERDVQVHRLVDMIENICKQNKGKPFSSDVFGASELIMKRRMDDVKRNLKDELRQTQEELENRLRMSETPRSFRSSSNLDERLTPRNKSTKPKKTSRKKNTKSKCDIDCSNNKSNRLPCILNDSMMKKKKDKRLGNTANDNLVLPSSSKCNISLIEEDDDFGDCDIEALKRRIEEDIDVPTLHLPDEDFIDEFVISNSIDYSTANGDTSIHKQMNELRKKYEEEIKVPNLRERIRRECEEERPELFQFMWKLSRYFDHSITNDKKT